MPKQAKGTQVPKFVNKTQEIYQYIHDHKGCDEREISKGLPHLSAPVIHASLKMLHDGGYVTKAPTTETNKIGRPICRFESVTSKKYEPTYARRPDGSRVTARKLSQVRGTNREAEQALALRSVKKKVPLNPMSKFESSMQLTLPTKHGPISLSISEAKDFYSELKKLFEDR